MEKRRNEKLFLQINTAAGKEKREVIRKIFM